MKTDIYEATINTHYLSALINGDESGLDDDKEAMQFMEWELSMYDDAKKDGAKNMCWEYEECYNYAKCDVLDSFAKWLMFAL